MSAHGPPTNILLHTDSPKIMIWIMYHAEVIMELHICQNTAQKIEGERIEFWIDMSKLP